MGKRYSKEERKWLMILCEMKCHFCPKEPAQVAHHIRVGLLPGMSKKSEMWHAIPCCGNCHTQLHDVIGERPFYKINGYEPEDLINYAKELYDEYNYGT